jgi:hypothetical protein
LPPPTLERALAARRESRRVAFKPGLDEWSDVIRDIVAMANSGGGVILFGVDKGGNPTATDLSRITAGGVSDQLRQTLDVDFHDVTLTEFRKASIPILAMIVGPAPTPIVLDGIVYFRHGGKSQRGTSADVAIAMDRQLRSVRRSWLSAVRRVVHEERPEPTAEPLAIRVVDDRRAPAYRVVDYDRTHPYRQKELLAALRQRGFAINQFDLRAVRHVHGTDANPDFAHKPVFGSRQYSEKFLRWLEEQATSNPRFFAEAREQFRQPLALA